MFDFAALRAVFRKSSRKLAWNKSKNEKPQTLFLPGESFILVESN
jgi:hypothetical protein